MPYTDVGGVLFMDQQPHRSVEDFPGVSAFNQFIKDFSSDINLFLEVSEDICTYTENTAVSNAMARVIGELIEAKLRWLEDEHDEKIPHRPEPTIFLKEFVHLQEKLTFIKGADESIEPAAFNFDLTKTQGGYEF